MRSKLREVLRLRLNYDDHKTNFISNTDNHNSSLIICDTRTNFPRMKWMRMTKNVNKCALIGMTKNRSSIDGFDE